MNKMHGTDAAGVAFQQCKEQSITIPAAVVWRKWLKSIHADADEILVGRSDGMLFS